MYSDLHSSFLRALRTASSILRLRSPPTFPNLLRSILQVQLSVFLTQILEQILRISPAKWVKASPPVDGSDSASPHRTCSFYPAYTYPAGPACHFITHRLTKHKIIRNRQFLIAFCHPCSPLTHLQENKQQQYAEQTLCPSSSPALLYLMG